MTREEAINILNEWVGIGQLGESCSLHFEADLDDVDDALEMAISALKEQEERSEGCDYCNELHPARDCIIGNVERMLVGRSFADAYVQEREVKFCPICGRRLEEV